MKKGRRDDRVGQRVAPVAAFIGITVNQQPKDRSQRNAVEGDGGCQLRSVVGTLETQRVNEYFIESFAAGMRDVRRSCAAHRGARKGI